MRQLKVLRWIGDGCPPGVMTDTTYKATAVALKSRRLATVTKKRGVWQAALTAAGRHFLDSGSYPAGHWDLPDREPTPGQVAVARRRAATGPKVTALRPVEQLLADLTAAPDGRVVVTEGSSGYWQNLVASATRHGKVPAGKVVTVGRGGSWTEHVIVLGDAPAWITTELTAVPVEAHLRRPHPVVAALRDNTDRLPFKRDVRRRALRLLDALAKEAERRGYAVSAPKPDPGHTLPNGVLEVTITWHPLALVVTELNDRVPHEPTARELRDQQRYPHSTRIPTHDHVPSGRLQITIATGSPIQQEKFADTKTITLDDRLARALRELELRAATFDKRRLQRERDAIAKQQRWEHAVEIAQAAAREHHRAEALMREVAAWRKARELDNYLSAMTARVADLDGPARSDAEEWLAWAAKYQNEIDPMGHRLRLPPDPQFTPEVIKPFMGGLSPYAANAW